MISAEPLRERSEPRPLRRRVKRLTIAIDGPSGAGKSTVASLLSRRLGYLYIDTGAMYRSVALKVREEGIIPEDEFTVSRLASSLQISFASEGEQTHVFSDGRDVTEFIRTPDISRLASSISKQKRTREALVRIQRKMGKEGGVILEGRDIGTVVFPDADVKFYLDADADERVRRRFREMTEKGIRVRLKETGKELLQRDYNDMHRSHSPLQKADDALVIDTTHRSVEEIVEEMVHVVKARKVS